jgi:hypothetical protein
MPQLGTSDSSSIFLPAIETLRVSLETTINNTANKPLTKEQGLLIKS